MSERDPQSADKEHRAKVSPQEPDLLMPWSEIEATCKRIMKESDDLINDSADYRIGQWSGAEKVLFALDCAAERIRLTTRSAGTRIGNATEDGPLGSWRAVGPDAVELDFMLTQYVIEIQTAADDATSVEDSIYHDTEALKLKRQIIDRFARSATERRLLEEGLAVHIRTHPHRELYRKQLESGELARRLTNIGPAFDPDGSVTWALAVYALISPSDRNAHD